jgi:hypothetical protein
MAFKDTRLNKLTKSATDLLATRDQLSEDQKARFDEIWENSQTELAEIIKNARDFEHHSQCACPSLLYLTITLGSSNLMTRRLGAT